MHLFSLRMGARQCDIANFIYLQHTKNLSVSAWSCTRLLQLRFCAIYLTTRNHADRSPGLRGAEDSTERVVSDSAAAVPRTGRARRSGSRCCSSRWAAAARVRPVGGRRRASLGAHFLQQVRRRIDLAHQPAQVTHVHVHRALVARVEHPAGADGFPVAVEVQADQFATCVEYR